MIHIVMSDNLMDKVFFKPEYAPCTFTERILFLFIINSKK